jgi:hypothetical protein
MIVFAAGGKAALVHFVRVAQALGPLSRCRATG